MLLFTNIHSDIPCTCKTKNVTDNLPIKKKRKEKATLSEPKTTHKFAIKCYHGNQSSQYFGGDCTNRVPLL